MCFLSKNHFFYNKLTLALDQQEAGATVAKQRLVSSESPQSGHPEGFRTFL